MKKILSLILVLSILLSAMSVFAAQDVPMYAEGASGIDVNKHTETKVINIEGQIAYGKLVPDKEVTVLITNADESEVYYITELTPDFVGKYSIKFVCDAGDDAVIKIKYDGKDVSDTLTIGTIDGKSTIMEAEIVLLNERGSLFSQDSCVFFAPNAFYSLV